jgi:hypothetical protein
MGVAGAFMRVGLGGFKERDADHCIFVQFLAGGCVWIKILGSEV